MLSTIRRHWVFSIYLAVLAASHVVRLMHPVDGQPDSDESVVQVSAVKGDRLLPRPVRIAFLDRRPSATDSPPVIVLLHGSPGDNGEVGGLGEQLSAHYRTIAPDLPGFGGSTWDVPDYSIRAHARYVLQLLDSLHIERFHVVGFSMGGGVALNLAELAPERVSSLTMLSAIGAQEYELLGEYHLNHAVHGLQLAGLWLLREGLPHFGWLDDADLNVEYARNFYDSDQRPLRGILQHWEGPALVIQGDQDPLVAPAAALEHYRLMPQSDLRMFQGADHFMAFRYPEKLAEPIGNLVDRTEKGVARTRATASPERIAQARRPFDPQSLPRTSGLALVILLLLIAAATLVSEDLACIATGFLVARGTIGFLPGTIACFLGILIGDLLLFLAGRFLGRAALRRAPLRWFISDADVDRSSAWFARRGPVLVAVSRFLPGTRLPTYFTAGVLRTSIWSFTLYFTLAGAVWTPLLVGLSAVLGETVLTRWAFFQRDALNTLLVALLTLVVVFKLIVPMLSLRGRRLLLSRYRRLTRWEFWPPWAFYPPVVCYILWLGLKHRSLTLFTSVNPAIPGGGFVGESKGEILKGLAHAPDRVARTRGIAGNLGAVARVETALLHMTELALEYPVVLKPDIGERGSGVGIIHNRKQLTSYLTSADGDLLLQEHVTGEEFGVFYFRRPGEERGQIFSITEKRFPSVVGDGTRTLEELILLDDRAVCMARFFLDRHADRLELVPEAGQRVPLVELGTHCRGAAFYDGEWVRTPELEAEIDRLSRGFEGFWFGRYDIRTPSVEDFRRGQNFKVIELNGATAEATSIYDPKNGLLSAYGTLLTQWRVLFKIAARNRETGSEPVSLAEFFRMLRRHRRAIERHVQA